MLRLTSVTGRTCDSFAGARALVHAEGRPKQDVADRRRASATQAAWVSGGRLNS